MNNYNTKKRFAKAENDINSVDILRSVLKEEEQALISTKNNLGYEHLSIEELLKLQTDQLMDVQASQLLELQENFRKLEEEKKILCAADLVIEEFNKKHAIVHVGQTYVLTEKHNAFGEFEFTLENRQSFKNYYEATKVTCPDGKIRCKADIWLQSPLRRQYEGITFDPTTTGPVRGYYNIWRGFAKTPKQGDCSKYWNHAKENICSNNTESYQYLRKWVAFVFQRPHEVHTAIVLCGSQGVGKNSFVEPLGVLFGQHYLPLSSMFELVSHFNLHQKNAVLIHANEALWGGHKKELGTVKTMVTDKYCIIEGKGRDPIKTPNFRHIILSSNEDWPVHLDADDRRFFVLKISEGHKEDRPYFAAIQKELDHGGYEALLYDLLNEDLTDFDPRTLPPSNDAFDIKLQSASSSHRYIYMVLKEGHFLIGRDTYGIWQNTIPKDDVYTEYKEWAIRNSEKIESHANFGRMLRAIIPSIGDYRPGKPNDAEPRPRQYKLPPLEKARHDFCKAFKVDSRRIFNNDVETSE